MQASSIQRARSVWKGPHFATFPGMQAALQNGTQIQTQARSSTILPAFVGLKLLVHNGNKYVPLSITQEMVGHKLGELVPTKKNWSFRQTKAGR